ncbi:MAG: type II methionyl aminopeptidase [Planctomycetota bacterium]|jgi:methionyl aminopeptidase|nr:type II methionyl aminopeptidase [Planctomycetota bacterium]
MRVDLEKYREAGRINAEARRQALESLAPGVRYVDVLDAAEAYIRSQGAELAFPAQVSVNEVAAHDCCDLDDPRVFEDGDVIKLDFGVHVDGCIADGASTHELGNRHGDLLEASRHALEAAIALVRPNRKIRDIAAAIQSTMRELDYQPVANLTGHGIAPYTIHCSPAIPNVPEGTSGVLKEGMMICIEPFATTGRGYVEEKGRAEVFGARRKLKPPKHVDSGVIDQIMARRGMPFCRRELAREHGVETTENSLRDLLRVGAVFGYPPLVEHGPAFVAQFEHTMFVGPEGAEVMTR